MNSKYGIEPIEYRGQKLFPVTDVIHDIAEGIYTNVVEDGEGDRYEAFYTQSNFDKDDWNEPFRIEAII